MILGLGGCKTGDLFDLSDCVLTELFIFFRLSCSDLYLCLEVFPDCVSFLVLASKFCVLLVKAVFLLLQTRFDIIDVLVLFVDVLLMFALELE